MEEKKDCELYKMSASSRKLVREELCHGHAHMKELIQEQIQKLFVHPVKVHSLHVSFILSTKEGDQPFEVSGR